LHNLLEGCHTVHLGHCDVHSHEVHVRMQFLVLFDTLLTVHCNSCNLKTFGSQNLLNLLCYEHRVVDNQNPVRCTIGLHALSSSFVYVWKITLGSHGSTPYLSLTATLI